MEVATVRVKHKEAKVEMVINMTDFDPDLHELVEKKDLKKIDEAKAAEDSTKAAQSAELEKVEKNAAARKRGGKS